MNTTTTNTTTSKMPPITKGSATYKLIVPVNVEEKIRYLLRKFPSTEWSGVLFYTHQGSFEDNDLVITCQDIFPMDLGNAVFTQFCMNEDVAAYMAENLELFDCEIGLVHSHHYMSTQPSGTDIQTLGEEGNERNCFVSLIVNNAGTYYAAITRKVQTKSRVTIKNLGSSYEFFGEGPKQISNGHTESVKEVNKEVIEYFDLNVERHEVANSLAYLDARFDEIVQKKKGILQSQMSSLDDIKFKSNSPKEPTLFDTVPFKGKSFLQDNKTYQWTPNSKKVHKALVTILTCSFITNPSSLELKQWINKHMTRLYIGIFGEDSAEEDPNTGGAFTEWCEFIIQHILDHFDYPKGTQEDDYYFEYCQVELAKALTEEIFEYVGSNPYIDAYYNTLKLYY